MNIQIAFAALAAVLIIVASYRHLSWKAIIYLGLLFLVAAAVALLLNYQNDNITWSIPVGGDLFRLGDSASILGEHWWLALLGSLTGVVLMIAGVVKRIRMPLPEPAVAVEDHPLTEQQKINQAMGEEIQNVQEALGDPGESGKRDALTPGGVKPHRHEAEPTGFEKSVRDQYQEHGTAFVRNTVERLKREIVEALAKLEDLKETLSERYYAQKADAIYRDNAEEPDSVKVTRLRENVTRAGQAYDRFISALSLHPGVQPEWDKPTSTKELVLLGGIAAIVEFGVSYLFLKDEIGSNAALVVAAVAMVVVFMLAFLLAANFKLLRRPHAMLKRVAASFGYVALLSFLFLGLGLLLEYRTVATEFSTNEISDTFRTILNGYGSMLTSINNLVLFLVNLFAFVLFYWKCLLRFERFSGYRRVNEERNHTQEKWDEMFDINSAAIKEALGNTSNTAKEKRDAANQAVKDLHEKRSVLENIQANLTTSLLNLHLAYQNDVNEYRTSNAENRKVEVNPPPIYFHNTPPFCSVEDHFVGDHDVDNFLNKHQKAIIQANEERQRIDQAATDWPNARAKLNADWAKKFNQQVQGPEN